MTRLHSEIDVAERVRAEVSSCGRNVEIIAASLTNTANMRDEAVKRAYNFSAQLAASADEKRRISWSQPR